MSSKLSARGANSQAISEFQLCADGNKDDSNFAHYLVTGPIMSINSVRVYTPTVLCRCDITGNKNDLQRIKQTCM